MNYYKATVQYDGTDYFGFQWQKGIPTIQNEINQGLSRLVGGKITTVGASRTDTGVHAIQQIVKITSEHEIEWESFSSRFNQALSPQVRCLNIKPCEGSFHPINSGAYKQYRYLFTNTLQSSGLEKRFVANYPYELNIALMQECAQAVIGVHDFKHFCSAGSNVKTTIREVSSCEVSEVDPQIVLAQSEIFTICQDLNRCFQLKIEGAGFLKQMVRHLMSALWLVGRGKISPEEFLFLLTGEGEKVKRWKVSTPRGLYLYELRYPKTK